ncbi:MAG: tryptophan-rich sensory protein [Bacillota bacterium]|nr:tryptophan-rich sensory protein [Bacillota bacterium]
MVTETNEPVVQESEVQKPPQAELEKSAQTQVRPKAQPGFGRSILVLIVLIVMIAVNAMANILPINNLTTGAISDDYFPNLFAPAGLTFSIWGLIYLLLAAFTVFQFFQPGNDAAAKRLKFVQLLFVISSIANAAWIFCWHYLLLPVSLVLMLVILVSLAVINHRMAKEKHAANEWLLLRLPFSIYFGWITVATVANVTALLVDIEWNRLGLSEPFWTVVILIIATAIALAVIGKNRDWAYGAVVVWAYAGILIKHLEPDLSQGFGGQYIMVIVTVSICLGFVAAASFLAILGRKVRFVTKGNTAKEEAAKAAKTNEPI